MGAAFLPAPLGFLAWFGFVPLLVALDRRRASRAPLRGALRLGYVFGFVFFLIGTHWIALLSDVAITVPWLKYPAWLCAAGYLACFPALAALLAVGLARRSGWSLAITFPTSFLAVEGLRAGGELGFPWFQPGYSQSAYLPLAQMASLGSVTLVTLWVLCLNVLVWRALAAGEGRVRAAAGAGLALLLPWLWGMRVLATPPPPGGPRPTIALVQADIAGEMKWSGRHQREILRTFLSLSENATRHHPRPSLIVWPETATGSYLRKQFDQSIEVAELVARTGVPIFSGFPDYTVDERGAMRYFNAAGMFLPNGGTSAIYAKRHLVPFGERMPFQRWFPRLGKLELGQAEWTPGESGTLFQGPGGPFSCLVCFEAIFPDLSRSDVRAGARWLVNITNDEWFGISAAIGQHAAMATFRAIENHVPLARCANTGLTILVDSYGRVTGRLPVFRPGVLIGELPPPGRTTFYQEIGDWPAWLAGLFLAFLFFVPGPARGRETASR